MRAVFFVAIAVSATAAGCAATGARAPLPAEAGPMAQAAAIGTPLAAQRTANP